jgi:UDP-glucose:(heptosyl)LPS alpha-1,3-glucosyltransferase
MRAFATAFREATRTGFDRTVAFQPMPAGILLLADGLFDRPDVALWKRLTPRFRTFAGLEAACLSPGSRTRVIGLADTQMATLASRYAIAADRIAILPPTVNPDSRRPKRLTEAERRQLRADLGVGPSGPVWLWIGLQPSVKGLDRVVEALALAPEAQLIVCGLPETSKKIQPVLRKARRSGVNARIRCLGFMPSEEDRFYDVLRAADVLAHPARTDTTGTVILEAIVNGLPVVATGICGYSEHIRRSGAGMVLGEPFDLRGLSEALAAVSGRRDDLSEKGIAYGADPMLYAGVAKAVELIEAPLDRPWPVSAGKAGAVPADEVAGRIRPTPAEGPTARRAQSR